MNPRKPVPIVRTGKPALQCATQTIAVAGNLMRNIRKQLTAPHHGARSAAIKPITVIGATSGAAITFATTAIGAM